MNQLELGQVVMTRGISDMIDRNPSLGIELHKLFSRHASGDDGNLGEEDKESNRKARKHGDRILSAYELGGEKVWIITEWDRSVTTALLPEEY